MNFDDPDNAAAGDSGPESDMPRCAGALAASAGEADHPAADTSDNANANNALTASRRMTAAPS
jgi:hypothetical protein